MPFFVPANVREGEGPARPSFLAFGASLAFGKFRRGCAARWVGLKLGMVWFCWLDVAGIESAVVERYSKGVGFISQWL